MGCRPLLLVDVGQHDPLQPSVRQTQCRCDVVAVGFEIQPRKRQHVGSGLSLSFDVVEQHGHHRHQGYPIQCRHGHGLQRESVGFVHGPYQLQFRRTLPADRIGSLRRFVSIGQRQQMGVLPVGSDRLAYQPGVVVARQGLDQQPETARRRRYDGQLVRRCLRYAGRRFAVQDAGRWV